MFRKLGLALILPLASLSAGSWCERFDLEPLKGGSFSGGIDLLYWSCMDCGFEYANLVSASVFCADAANAMTVFVGPTENKFVVQDSDLGVRGRLRYSLPACVYFEVDYLWFDVTSRASASIPVGANEIMEPSILFSDYFNTATPGGSNLRIDGKYRNELQEVNVKAAGQIAAGDWGQVYLDSFFTWLRSDNIRSSSAVATFTEEPLYVTQRNKVVGPGIGTGAGVDLNMCSGLHLFAYVAVHGYVLDSSMSRKGVASHQGTQRMGEPFAYDLDFSIPNRVCYVTGWRMSGGIGYQRQCGCATVGAELSFEEHFILGGIAYRVGQASPGPDGEDPFFGELGWGGPTLRLQVGF